MAKPRTTYRCTECGATSPKWVGRCTECQAWGTVAELASGAVPTSGLRSSTTGVAPTRRARPVSEIAEQHVTRTGTGLGEFDRVIGGGLVPGQVVLVAGEPGVGKSTILLEVGHRYAESGRGAVLYVSGGRRLVISGEQEAVLRRFVTAGGMVWFDAIAGEGSVLAPSV